MVNGPEFAGNDESGRVYGESYSEEIHGIRRKNEFSIQDNNSEFAGNRFLFRRNVTWNWNLPEYKVLFKRE